MRRSKRVREGELREEAINKKAGACGKGCGFKQELIVRFPSEGRVTRMTGDNASVRVVCEAVGGREVRTVLATKPEHCHRFQRKQKKLARKQAERRSTRRVSVVTPSQD